MARKAAVVTGSDSGIGRAIAIALARDGFDAGITWHSDEEGARETARLCEEHDVRTVVRQLDASDLPDAARVVDAFAEELGRLDAFVNNAGMGEEAPFLEMTFEQWRKMLATNLDGPFVLAQRAAQIMVKQGDGGRIVNVTSVHEFTPIDKQAHYTASKHGLGGLTKNMAMELSAHGILVNSVAPGMIATPMNDMEAEDAFRDEQPDIPLKRAGTPDEIAGLVAWLCGPAATYATGKSYIVDGGLTLNMKTQ